MKKSFKILICALVVLAMAGIGGAYTGYRMLYQPNIRTDAPEYLYIPSGSDYNSLLNLLDSTQILKHPRSFQWVAQASHLPGHLRSGRYRLDRTLGNLKLVRNIRSGNQTAVRISFNNIRTLPQLAQRLAGQLEFDSAAFLQTLLQDSLLQTYGVDSATAICLFIPNTYECWWNSSPQEFIRRMHQEYLRFWNAKRIEKAAAIPLSPLEVMTLASIVEEENFRPDEQPRIAGLYINRLRKNMLLQSDPTVKFAIGDFAKSRLLYKDLEIDSPYNTYKQTGLPPGPIRMASISAIDAVLNYEHHPYIYMCAKEDFSGYHNFTQSAAVHAANAYRYHTALNRLKK